MTMSYMPILTNQIVIEKAKQIGFDLVGFVKADLLEDEAEKLLQWLDKGYQASMNYMEKNLHKRKDVKEILPTTKSVISLALNYYSPENHSNENEKGKVSRYAWGKDYHLIIWQKLDELETILKELEPELETLSYVDTGPVMDKAWAVRAGIGWMGKHTNVINPDYGSWFFIATIITNCEFDYSEIDSLALFKGTHPAVMQDLIKRKNWVFDHDLSKNKITLKSWFKRNVKLLTGIEIGYKNYKII